MAFNQNRNCKTACTSTISLSFPFPFPVVYPTPPSKRASTAQTDSDCSPGKCADSQQTEQPILLSGHRSAAQGTTRCQVNPWLRAHFISRQLCLCTEPTTVCFVLHMMGIEESSLLQWNINQPLNVQHDKSNEANNCEM